MPVIKLDIHDRRLTEILPADGIVERIAAGFKFLEGPAWHPYQKHLRFSDILGNSILQWGDSEGLSLYRRNSFMANGNTYDREGRFLSCHHATNSIARAEADGVIKVLASHYGDKALNSPDDLVVKSDGSVYFTDPPYGHEAKVGFPHKLELDFSGVYRWDPADESLTLLTKAFDRPNGLCFSKDESRLYLTDSNEYNIHVFEVGADGLLAKGRHFAKTQGDEPGVPDGIKVDIEDNLYCAAQGGLHVFKPDGSFLGRLLMSEVITNFTWGDDDMRSLYLTGHTTLYRLRSKIPGRPLF